MMKIARYPMLVLLLAGLVACRRSDSAKPHSPGGDNSVGINTSPFDGTYLVPDTAGGHEVTFRNGRYTGGAPPFPSGDLPGNGTYTARSVGYPRWELNLKVDVGGEIKTTLRKDGNDLWMGDEQVDRKYAVKLLKK